MPTALGLQASKLARRGGIPAQAPVMWGIAMVLYKYHQGLYKVKVRTVSNPTGLLAELNSLQAKCAHVHVDSRHCNEECLHCRGCHSMAPASTQ
jgi:hypothetical protein